jgi:hypothetical protein
LPSRHTRFGPFSVDLISTVCMVKMIRWILFRQRKYAITQRVTTAIAFVLPRIHGLASSDVQSCRSAEKGLKKWGEIRLVVSLVRWLVGVVLL